MNQRIPHLQKKIRIIYWILRKYAGNAAHVTQRSSFPTKQGFLPLPTIPLGPFCTTTSSNPDSENHLFTVFNDCGWSWAGEYMSKVSSTAQSLFISAGSPRFEYSIIGESRDPIRPKNNLNVLVNGMRTGTERS